MDQQHHYADTRAESQPVPMPENGVKGCLLEAPLEPCTLVIFGASGDLTARKLIPALYNLYLNDGLPEPYLIVGVARSEMSDEAFRERLKKGVTENTDHNLDRWDDFSTRLFYYPAEYDSLESMFALAEYLRRVDREHNTNGNRIFYLATPPSVAGPVSDLLGRTGLSDENKEGNGFTRIVIEKPFSFDLESARELNTVLHRGFDENQIFRIDHYMAKETVQSMLMFRFANTIFEPVWNRRYIDHVCIMAAETVGVEHRAGYYEQAGVLRDMFQSHMLQLLAICAMEPPPCFNEDRVRDEKVKVFRSLRPFPVQELDDYIILGQYGPGRINDQDVIGYRDEPKVSPESTMPTFAMLKTNIENWRWQGVPFYLISGKRLPRKETRIIIKFKRVPHLLFSNALPGDVQANRLTLGIQPEETIHLTFETKNPGAQFCSRTVRMRFDYLQDYQGPVLDAYDKALLDTMKGDHMLFWREDGVELAWDYMMPLIEACEKCHDPGSRLHLYPAGSWGPDETDQLFPDSEWTD
jgi:glucose-6-phosphate 1-dehydrogenase